MNNWQHHIEQHWPHWKQDLLGGRFMRAQLSVLVGTLLIGAVINGWAIPGHIYSGGVTGLSQLILHWTGLLGLGWIYLLLNIPLLILGWRQITPRFVAMSSMGTLISTFSFQVTSRVRLPPMDPLMTSIVCGVLVGVGAGLYLRSGGSAGGLDILGTYIRKRFALPMGVTFNFFNFGVLAAAFSVNGLETSFYSGIFIFVNAWMIDKVQSGFNQRHAVMIITQLPQELSHAVQERLHRGVTFIQGMGGHSGMPRLILLTVVNRTELGRLKDLIYEVDAAGMVVVLNTSAVIGEQFNSWQDEGYRPKRIDLP